MQKFLDDATRKKIDDHAKVNKTRVKSVGYFGGDRPKWIVEFENGNRQEYPYGSGAHGKA